MANFMSTRGQTCKTCKTSIMYIFCLLL